MKAKVITLGIVVAALSISPAFAAKKKTMKRSAAQQTSVPGAVVAGAGAVVGGAVTTAGAIATAPFTMGPVSTLNGPTCKPGTMITVGGKKMRCQ
jgi:hypothetical protein